MSDRTAVVNKQRRDLADYRSRRVVDGRDRRLSGSVVCPLALGKLERWAELIESIFVRPYTRMGNPTNAGIAKRQTASVYLNKLAQAKVLSSAQFGRNKLLVNPAFLRLPTEDAMDK
jgi:hypothetical protein